jgi:hypothetical protein
MASDGGIPERDGLPSASDDASFMGWVNRDEPGESLCARVNGRWTAGILDMKARFRQTAGVAMLAVAQQAHVALQAQQQQRVFISGEWFGQDGAHHRCYRAGRRR